MHLSENRRGRGIVTDPGVKNPALCVNSATIRGCRGELDTGTYLACIFSAAHEPQVCRYDRGADDICRSVTSFCGGAPIRLQTLPVQKNLPTAQASTRSVFGSLMAIVA
jgi:hypothetical protein